MKIKNFCLKYAVVPALVIFAVNTVSASPFIEGSVVSEKPLSVISADSSSQKFCVDFKNAFEAANVTATISKNGLPVMADSTGTFSFGTVAFVKAGNLDLRHVMVAYRATDGKVTTNDLVFDHHDNDKNTNVDAKFGPCTLTLKAISLAAKV